MVSERHCRFWVSVHIASEELPRTLQYIFLFGYVVVYIITFLLQTGESVGFRVEHYQEVLRRVLLRGSPGN